MSRTRRAVDYNYGLAYDTNRDKKKGYKPGRVFKQIRSDKRKAKERDAMRHWEENDAVVPVFRREDQWLYN